MALSVKGLLGFSFEQIRRLSIVKGERGGGGGGGGGGVILQFQRENPPPPLAHFINIRDNLKTPLIHTVSKFE